MTITLTCPVCNEEKTVELTPEEYENYLRYTPGRQLVQDVFPNVDPKVRELLRGGMCADCWNMYFGTPPWENNGEEDEEYEEYEEDEETQD